MSNMNLGIVVYSRDSEVVWNAFRFSNFALAFNDEVRIFLIAQGVECQSLDTDIFKVNEQIDMFLKEGGKVFICGTCLEIRKQKAPEIFYLATLKELYDLVEKSDKVISF